jgi:hypothetical protein
MKNCNPNIRNGNCPVCGKAHAMFDDAWKCGIEAGYTLALFRDNYDLVPDEAYRMAYLQVLDITQYLKSLPGYIEEKEEKT